MVSANEKGKKPEEDDHKDPKEEEILVGYEEDMEQDKHPDTRATVASIGVVEKPTKLRRIARMSTGGRTPRHILAPRSLPNRTTRSSHVGKEHSKKYEWGKNNMDWNSRPDMIMNRIEQNS